MANPNDKSDPSQSIGAAVAEVVMKELVLPALTSLHRALEISTAYDWQLNLEDIGRVESFWELLDLDATSHGFVLSLHDGRRCYLQYVMAPDGDEVAEDIEVLPMKDERHPDLQGGGITWNDEVERLNQLLQD